MYRQNDLQDYWVMIDINEKLFSGRFESLTIQSNYNPMENGKYAV